ncbi:hypothetical protein T10_5629 [Trichinella papuae]|uniref:FLYWCH-type domain-containing protein n=1 Tax=Trichinella papuae TaxID=268474 RepID=A0A0V1MBI2_9BILA|nr:hypothetical protein T10_5629 [Trichinella papuae]
MTDISELRLVANRMSVGGGMSLVFEGKAYKLKHTNKQKKCWRCSKDKEGCDGTM